jgi:hypothetical protein
MEGSLTKMNITHDEDRFIAKDKKIEALAKIIDGHAFQVQLYVEEVGKDFHLPKNVYWAERRNKALTLAKKIIDAGYSND